MVSFGHLIERKEVILLRLGVSSYLTVRKEGTSFLLGRDSWQGGKREKDKDSEYVPQKEKDEEQQGRKRKRHSLSNALVKLAGIYIYLQ